nr:uncharacterized protein LOC109180617 [Ipomoea batatas]
MMEANVCDVNHLDADVLLPPRKRLLAGLKKQNSDVNSYTPSPSTASSSSTGSEFDTRLNNLLRSHLSKPGLSNEEIIETSRLAAVEAAKVAKAARAAAEEKAAKAARAVSAAKNALELVANINKEAASRDRQSKKNKTKKHVAVQTLYNKHKGIENSGTDEELARKLHTAINSSPRISKSSAVEMRNHKHKRLKTSPPSEKGTVSNGVTSLEGPQLSKSNGHGVGGLPDSKKGSVPETGMLRLDLNISKFNNSDHPVMENAKMLQFSTDESSKMENWEGEATNTAETTGEHMGRKKGRFKQKKLPLSICNFRDQKPQRGAEI